MRSVSKVCAIILFFIVAALVFEFGRSSSCLARKGVIEEGLESLKDLTTKFPNSLGFGSASKTNAPPKGEATDSLNAYFTNPSKELNVPETTAFFQNVPQPEEEKEAIDAFGKQMAQDISKESFNIKDFLPQEIHEEWFQTDLGNAKKEVDQAALIDISKFCQGVDTVGQSLKNPSLDIRGNIPNPKIVVSPFLNSSYDPDTNIKSWC